MAARRSRSEHDGAGEVRFAAPAAPARGVPRGDFVRVVARRDGSAAVGRGAVMNLSALRAQIGAEVKMRLRSFATPIAILAYLAAAFFWIPDPRGNAASLTWDLPDGRVQSPVYSAAYVGFALAILSCIFLALAGFYLVAGTVRRDRKSGVGAILAATPLSKSAYLGGKLAAHFAYLLVLDVVGLLAGLLAYARWGAGPFSLAAFAGPYLLMTIPAIAAVSTLAVLFDVTPVLRSRGGLVLWFFVFLFGLVKLPMDLAGMEEESGRFRNPESRPLFDPAGLASDQWLVRRTIPANVTGVSTGHISRTQPIERVPWPGVPVTGEMVAIRGLNLALCAVPFALAVLIFDRFDPARGRKRRGAARPGLLARLSARWRRREEDSDADEPGAIVRRAAPLTPVTVHPSAKSAIVAEARLIWESASWVKWPLAVAAILAGLLPGNFAQGIFLLLLVPVISEAGAREDLAGTRALVFSQPGVPRSPVLWKTAAIGLFVLMLGAPMAARDFFASPLRGLACVAGLAAIAGAAAGLGTLTSGGKLFTGLYVVVWYMGMSSAPFADFTASLSDKPQPVWGAVYLGIAAAMVLAALGREKLRRA